MIILIAFGRTDHGPAQHRPRLFARCPAVFETFASVEAFLQSGDLDRTGCVVLPA